MELSSASAGMAGRLIAIWLILDQQFLEDFSFCCYCPVYAKYNGLTLGLCLLGLAGEIIKMRFSCNIYYQKWFQLENYVSDSDSVTPQPPLERPGDFPILNVDI